MLSHVSEALPGDSLDKEYGAQFAAANTCASQHSTHRPAA